jgi:hypothetical protein
MLWNKLERLTEPKYLCTSKGATTLSIKTIYIKIFSIMTLNIKGLFANLTINDTQNK